MSKVTGVALIARSPAVVGFADEKALIVSDPIAEIQQWLSKHHHGASLVEVADHAGGSKHPQYECRLAGVNCMSEDEFAKFVMSRRWNRPESVVLTLQPEEGNTRVFRPAFIEGAWRA